MQVIRRLEPLLNVAATSHFVCDTKKVLGNVVEEIVLDNTGSGALLKANLTNLVVKLNGKNVWGQITAAQVTSLQIYKNIVSDVSRTAIEFVEKTSRNIQGQLMGAVDTDASGVTSFVIEGDIGTATTPILTGWVQMRNPQSMSPEKGFDPATRGLISALIPTSVNDSAAGQFPHDINYGSRGNSLIKRVAIFSSTLTAFQVKADSVDLWENPVTALAGYLQAENGKDDQSGVYIWDPLMDGNQPDAVLTRAPNGNGQFRERNFEWLFQVSGSGSHTVFTDVYTTLANL
jgi:hypothetical protein